MQMNFCCYCGMYSILRDNQKSFSSSCGMLWCCCLDLLVACAFPVVKWKANLVQHLFPLVLCLRNHFPLLLPGVQLFWLLIHSSTLPSPSALVCHLPTPPLACPLPCCLGHLPSLSLKDFTAQTIPSNCIPFYSTQSQWSSTSLLGSGSNLSLLLPSFDCSSTPKSLSTGLPSANTTSRLSSAFCVSATSPPCL